MESMIKDNSRDKLKEMMKNVDCSRTYFEKNNQRFHAVRKFLFQTSITNDVAGVLKDVGKPLIESNIQGAYVARLLGEFSKQEPSVAISSVVDKPVDPTFIDFLEDHYRHLFYESNSNNLQYKTHKDALSGAFSCWKLRTDYKDEMAFEQDIIWEKCPDPTLVFFDPLARESSKEDAAYWGEIYPKRKEDFIAENPGVDISDIDFTRSNSIGGYNWSYTNGKEQILLECDYYEKRKKRKRIVQLSNGQTMLKDDYKKHKAQWDLNNHIEEPAIIVKERSTLVTVIYRYRFIKNKILEETETDYDFTNYIFVEGSSEYLQAEDGSISQMTIPYIFNTIGIQKLRNFILQTLGNEFENMIQHKFMVALESIPTEHDYAKAYTDVQKASVLVYKSFMDDNPNIRLDPPQVVQRPPIPAELLQTLMATEQMMQAALGSYDASLGINKSQLSGVAIVEGATQSNSAAMPYVVGHTIALNQLAKVYLSLIPKYWVTPMTVPIRKKDGTRAFIDINKKDGTGIQTKFDPKHFDIKVTSGVNFSIQKSRMIQQIMMMTQAFPEFAQMMGENGLKVIVENMEGKGVDELQVMAQQFMSQQKMMKQKMMQQQGTIPNPIQLKQQEIQQQGQIAQQKMQLDAQKNQSDAMIKQQQVNNDALKIQIQAQQAGNEMAVEQSKAQAEQFNDATELAIKRDDMHHNHIKDALELGMKHQDQSHRHLRESVETAHKVQNDHHAQEMAEKEQEPTKGERE